MTTQARILELFIYQPETGWLINRISRNSRAQEGERAGTGDGSTGYRRVWIDGKQYYEHRVIWCYATGDWPEEVDHINGLRNENQWLNLREVTRSQNCFNAESNTAASTLKGVYRRSDRSKWRSTITAGGQFHHIGDFDTLDEANRAYLEAAELYHGEHALHNRPQPLEQEA